MEQVIQRLTRIEQRIDSLTNAKDANSIGANNKGIDNSVSYGTVRETSQCRAITKKGTRCKRTSRNNGYCWQHER